MGNFVQLLIYTWFLLKEKVVELILHGKSLKDRVTRKHADCEMSTWSLMELTSLSVWVFALMRLLS